MLSTYHNGKNQLSQQQQSPTLHENRRYNIYFWEFFVNELTLDDNELLPQRGTVAISHPSDCGRRPSHRQDLRQAHWPWVPLVTDQAMMQQNEFHRFHSESCSESNGLSLQSYNSLLFITRTREIHPTNYRAYMWLHCVWGHLKNFYQHWKQTKNFQTNLIT